LVAVNLQAVLADMGICTARAMERTQQLWALRSLTTASAAGHASSCNAMNLGGVYPALPWLWQQPTSVLPISPCLITTADGATCLSSTSTWPFPLTNRLVSFKQESSPFSTAGTYLHAWTQARPLDMCFSCSLEWVFRAIYVDPLRIPFTQCCDLDRSYTHCMLWSQQPNGNPLSKGPVRCVWEWSQLHTVCCDHSNLMGIHSHRALYTVWLWPQLHTVCCDHSNLMGIHSHRALYIVCDCGRSYTQYVVIAAT
jgi:hypothetical protein